MSNSKIPHPLPYQGSKRNLAPEILRYFPKKFGTLYEPFAGSAAITIAAANERLGQSYHINDLNSSLMDLWWQIITVPDQLCQGYQQHWTDQQEDPKAYFSTVRDEFNKTGHPAALLYLMCRIVKGAIRQYLTQCRK